MKINFTLLSISILFLVSCQKEVSFDTNGGGTTPPSSSGTCNTYFPLSTGNTWTYDMGNGTTEVNTVVAPDSIIGGQTYKRIIETISGTATTVFFRDDNNGNIYGYADLGMAGVATGKVLINPIRSNASVGDTWKDSLIINGITEILQYTLIEKNINYQVDTFHFTNVQHVRYTSKINYPPVFNDQQVGLTDVWYAKCIGGIETINQSFFGGVSVSTTDQKIKSYTIH